MARPTDDEFIAPVRELLLHLRTLTEQRALVQELLEPLLPQPEPVAAHREEEAKDDASAGHQHPKTSDPM